MTAEIAILNKTCVALAADSAVTVELENSGPKIYKSENKLFMLSKYFPVGIMIFDNSSFVGIPWESIIKTYRNKLGRKCFNSLKEYADHFINYLKDENFVYKRLQKHYFKSRISTKFEELKKIIKGYSEDTEILITMASQICQNEVEDDVLNENRDNLRKEFISRFLDNKLEDTKALVNFIWDNKPEDFIEDIKKEDGPINYNSIIYKAIDDEFKEIPYIKEFNDKLYEIALYSFYENITSGIVIAGFGQKDYFPSLKSYKIAAKVQDELKYKDFVKAKIDHENHASIIPFAQREMVHAFIEGVTPKYRLKAEEIKNLIEDDLTDIIDLIKDNYSIKLGKEKIRKIYKTVKEKKEKLKKAIESQQNDLEYIRLKHMVPIIRSVSILPKDEIATMAESLVHITSLKRKVTIDEDESVGGAIDVALISKGDGFVWIKRKHYFERELNPNFFNTYYDKCET